MADYRIITISRQFVSGGRTIGKKLAEKLGIPCYDQEIIAAVAKESGFSKDYIAEHGDDVNTTWMGNIFHVGGSLSNQDVMWVAQSNVVRELAAKGPCVIVGRCADYILRDDYKLLKVFVFADVKARAERIVKLYGERTLSPEKRLKNKDRRRSAYYRHYTDLKWGDAANYHVSLDSGALGVDTCVDIIADVYAEVQKHDQ